MIKQPGAIELFEYNIPLALAGGLYKIYLWLVGN